MNEINYIYRTRKIARNAARRMMHEQHVPNVNKHMADETDGGKFWREVLLKHTITKFNSKKQDKRRKRK